MEDLREPGDYGYDPEVARHAGRYYGLRRGKVKDVRDPEKRGRVRVYVPSVMSGPENSEDQWTDWAMPCHAMGASNEDEGAFFVPPVGSPVWVAFELGHPDFPVYIGGFWTTRGQRPPLLAREEDDGTAAAGVTVADVVIPGSGAGNSTYPHNRVFKLASGFVIEIDDTPATRRMRVRHPTGSFIEINHLGFIVASAGSSNMYVHGDNVDVAAGNRLQLVADSQVRLGRGSANEALVKGTTFQGAGNDWNSAWLTFLMALEAATTVANVAAAAATMKTAHLTYQSAFANTILSTKVFTE